MATQVQAALAQLAVAHEQLLAFADDIWLGIDHHDPTKLQTGVTFITAYHQKLTQLETLAADIAGMVEQFTQAPALVDTTSRPLDKITFERTVRDLDKATPHVVSENFTYKRPFGFICRNYAASDVPTWRNLYATFCQALTEMDPRRFNALPENPAFTRTQGGKAFSRNASELRAAMPITGGVFAEVHYSANSIRDNIRKLLSEFGIPEQEMRIHLRQDRAFQQADIA